MRTTKKSWGELFEGTSSDLYKTWRKSVAPVGCKLKKKHSTGKVARIVEDEGLWMIIDGDEGTAWAIKEDEVLPVMMACADWLSYKTQG